MPAGRPAMFDTVEDLQQAVDRYFECIEEDGKRKPTISGLAHYLGFESRQSIYDYGERDGYSYIIKKAVLFIESIHEENLFSTSCTGSIFWLKNRGWKDNYEIEDKSKSEFLKFLESQK